MASRNIWGQVGMPPPSLTCSNLCEWQCPHPASLNPIRALALYHPTSGHQTFPPCPQEHNLRGGLRKVHVATRHQQVSCPPTHPHPLSPSVMPPNMPPSIHACTHYPLSEQLRESAATSTPGIFALVSLPKCIPFNYRTARSRPLSPAKFAEKCITNAPSLAQSAATGTLGFLPHMQNVRWTTHTILLSPAALSSALSGFFRSCKTCVARRSTTFLSHPPPGG